MTFEFMLCLGTIVVLAGIGAPIAYAILIAALLYLLAAGQGIGIAAYSDGLG